MSNSFSENTGCLIFLAIVIGIGYGVYSVIRNATDDTGWVSHDKAVDVYMKGDWLVGENRVCDGIQKPQADGTYLVDALICPSDAPVDNPHNITVRFWGKISRPDAVRQDRLPTWQCTRNSDGFTCKALD